MILQLLLSKNERCGNQRRGILSDSETESEGSVEWDPREEMRKNKLIKSAEKAKPGKIHKSTVMMSKRVTYFIPIIC